MYGLDTYIRNYSLNSGGQLFFSVFFTLKCNLFSMEGKVFWRCSVCNDIHYGLAGPEFCPTCQAVNVYIEVDVAEARAILDLGE